MRAWLRLFLPLAALIGAVFVFASRQDYARQIADLDLQQQTQLRLAEAHFVEVMVDGATDLRVIAGTPALRRFVNGEPDGRGLVEPLLAAFIGQDWTYHQLRLIDAQGVEQVRVQRTPEGPRIAPPAELQDKKDRDYLVETLAMLPGQVRISRFELNVERGVVELPRRQVLRLSTRIVTDRGTEYVLVASLRADVLLKGVRDQFDTADADAWLIDHEGYWVLHPDPSLRWGHQLDPTRRVQTALPELAAKLGASQGSVEIDRARYGFRRVQLSANIPDADQLLLPPAFDLVSVIPADRLPDRFSAAQFGLLLVVLLLAAIGCALLARIRARAEAAEQRTLKLLRDQAQAGEARAWIRERSYQLSLKVHAASEPVDFARTVLGELAPALGLTAACLYAVTQGRATGLASYGLAGSAVLRDFAPGQGLVGEALRTREERQLRPPPSGYLDVHGGLGAGPPTELRILPLWVHGRTVGVLELALSRVLLTREEEFLRATLPLLSLNLDGFLGRQPP